ncbi:hypothetical protein Godav_029403, partial [Gossypium davidsonii]|nr:hypothetical protein [Gossypium davidsonii]
MAAHSKMIFSKLLIVTDINKRLAVPSAVLATFHWRPYHHISVFIRYKTLANSLHNLKERVQETRILKVKVGREVHFFGIPEDGANAMDYGNGTGDHEHAAAEAYPHIITRNRQDLLIRGQTLSSWTRQESGCFACICIPAF